MAEPLIWLDGELVPPGSAHVSIFDHGLTVGDGVFETLKAVDGVPFAMRRHLDRLRRSAVGLGLDVPCTDDVLRDAMLAVAGSSGKALVRVRVTVTGGVAPLGSDREGAPSTVIIAAGPLEPPTESTAVVTVPWTRNERSAVAGLKTTSYAENVVALAHAKARGATEVLFANTRDELCEGTGSNVFVILGGRIVTPPLHSGCLAGVSRELVLEVSDAVEDDIPMADLARADEVFLTSTGRDVQSVHAIDGREIPRGSCTPLVAEAFATLVATTSDP
jgi:branched-chain amino acid aminotransferase